MLHLTWSTLDKAKLTWEVRHHGMRDALDSSADPHLSSITWCSAKVFFIWGGFCFIAIVFAYFAIPETMGLSLEQIDIMYRNSSVVNSPSYRRKILAEDVQDETKDAYFTADAQGKHSQSHIENKRDLEQASV